MTGLPPATGSRRIGWARLPAPVRRAVEAMAGSPVAGAHDKQGGFSEGIAARLDLADGRAVFLKAARGEHHHRREAAVMRRLPAAVPAPRLLGVHDDGDWVALLFEHADGHLPAQPWRPGELERVLAAVTAMTRALTPAPIAGGRPRVPVEARGDSLLHGDLYPFNVLLAPGRVHVVDWPHAWVGPAWCDVMTVLVSAVVSGIDPQPYAERNPLTAAAGPGQLDAYLAAHSAFHRRLAGRADDPHLAAMAAALGDASGHWLDARA